jgi:hypothetical protein
MRFHCKRVQSGDEISFPKKELDQKMSVTLCDRKNLICGVRTGHLGTEDKECSGRPTQVTIPENVNAIRSMILDIRRISTKKIAETRVYYSIIHKILDMKKLSANWVPKPFWTDFGGILWDFSNRLVTMDETWIHMCLIQRQKNNPRN